MASQYITFMIIFILGLSVVVLTNTMFLSMSEQFRENIADIEMDQILGRVKTNLQEMILIASDSNVRIQRQISLPTIIGEGFRYTIDISNSSTHIIIKSYTTNREIEQIVSFSLGQKYEIQTSGAFDSTSELLTLNVRTDSNKIIITLS